MKYQTHSLLIVVVQLPDGPRHDDGERYTWEKKRRGRSFICLRDSNHKIWLWGFHAANMKSFSFFSFSQGATSACQALSGAIVAGGLWSTQAGQDLSPCDSVNKWRAGHRTIVMPSDRLVYRLITRHANSLDLLCLGRTRPAAASQQDISQPWILSTSLALKCHQSTVKPHRNLVSQKKMSQPCLPPNAVLEAWSQGGPTLMKFDPIYCFWPMCCHPVFTWMLPASLREM